MSIRIRVLAITSMVLVASSAWAQGNWVPGDGGQVRFRLGLFEPEGSSDGWDALYDGFTGGPGDLDDLSWGFDVGWKMTRQSGFLFGLSYYEGSASSAYTDWVDGNGNDIRHTKRLRLNDLSVMYVLEIGPPAGVVRGYVGGGVGLVWYELTEGGSFIDFGSEGLDVITTMYGTDATTWELLAVAGVDVRLGWHWSLFFEGRWREADDPLGDDYSGLGDLDLSGLELGGGLAFKF